MRLTKISQIPLKLGSGRVLETGDWDICTKIYRSKNDSPSVSSIISILNNHRGGI